MNQIITIGGKKFPMPKLQLQHLLALAEIIDEPTDGTVRAMIDRSARILGTTIRASDASVTDEQVHKLIGNWRELDAIVGEILIFAGFKSGEAAPVASSASS